MENRCAICGAIAPKGRWVCINCDKSIRKRQLKEVVEEITIAFDNVMNQPSKLGEIVKRCTDAKADSGKPNPSLVPKEIIYEIEKVRSFGVKKYKDPDNWKKVDMKRYHEALLRHTLAVWDDVHARDKESGLLHLSHIACNVAFLLEMMKDKE